MGNRSNHNRQKTLFIFAPTYRGFVRQPDKNGNVFLCLDQSLAGEDILAGKDRLSGGSVRLADAISAASGDGGIYTQWPKIIARLLSRPSPKAGSVLDLAHWQRPTAASGEVV